ncbi:hypothetical protein C8R44DRAFT_915762 [Mycena epipterygia]|nr:hypothetical protein C8R44DRAFT_915762 [Mycena epipterygia]
MVHQSWTPLFALLSVVAAAGVRVPGLVTRQNDGVHLAITPTCGKLGGTVANANAGIVTSGMKTLVAFGDSYTSGGRSDGGTLPAAFLTGTSPRAGGRVTDGPVWAEDLASDLGATIKDYAVRARSLIIAHCTPLIIETKVSGAVVNVTLWPSEAGQSDFLHQAALFLSQNNVLTPATTLYTVFFGINDFGASTTNQELIPELDVSTAELGTSTGGEVGNNQMTLSIPMLLPITQNTGPKI